MPPVSILIRQAEPRDAAQIVRLIQELSASLGEQSPISVDYAQECMASSGLSILLAEQAGAVTGLLSYSIRPDLYHAAPTALIEELVVSPEARSQGLGGALLQASEEAIRAAGCVEISVSVMPDNHRAIQFYRLHGLTDEALYLEKHLEGSSDPIG